MYYRLFLCLFLLPFSLSSCAKVCEKNTVFIPPTKKESASCANGCIKERNQCFQKCLNRESILDLGGHSFFIPSFEKSVLNDNPTVKACRNLCREMHVLCHRNCGGVVVVEKSCQPSFKRSNWF